MALLEFPIKDRDKARVTIEKLDIKPTDAVIVTVSGHSDPHAVMRLCEQIKEFVPECSGLLVLAGGAGIKDIPVERMNDAGWYHESQSGRCPNCDWFDISPQEKLERNRLNALDRQHLDNLFPPSTDENTLVFQSDQIAFADLFGALSEVQAENPKEN